MEQQTQNTINLNDNLLPKDIFQEWDNISLKKKTRHDRQERKEWWMSSNLTTSAVSSFIDSLIEVSDSKTKNKKNPKQHRVQNHWQAFLWRPKRDRGKRLRKVRHGDQHYHAITLFAEKEGGKDKLQLLQSLESADRKDKNRTRQERSSQILKQMKQVHGSIIVHSVHFVASSHFSLFFGHFNTRMQIMIDTKRVNNCTETHFLQKRRKEKKSYKSYRNTFSCTTWDNFLLFTS